MNQNAKWISAFEHNSPVNPELAGIRKDVYEGFDPKNFPKDTKAFQFAKNFEVKNKIMSAELKVTACGYFKAYINGFRIGRDVLTPSFTDFDRTIYYSTYDISNYITENNRISLLVGNGYYNMYEDDTWNFGKAPWRGQAKAIATITLEYLDGTSEEVLTDETWKYTESAIQYQNIRSGEYHDMNLYHKNWTCQDFDISDWKPVYIHSGKLAPKGTLKKEIIKPIKKFRDHKQDAKIISIEKLDENIHLVTLDKNTVGWTRIRLTGKKDDVLKFEFIEYDDNKNLDVFTKNTFQTFEVRLSGREEFCEPKFSYYGFKYIKIYGNYEPQEEDFTIYSVHNDFKKHSEFFCDNETINKIHDICARTYIENWQSIPTDCPTREKNGWTADGWLACEYGLMNYSSLSGYKKWLRDIALDWETFGDPSPIIPNPGWGNEAENNRTYDPIWSGVMIMLNFYIYKYTMDKKFLASYYPYMKEYIERVEGKFEDGLLTEKTMASLGDWADWNWENMQSIYTDKIFVSNAFVYILMQNMAYFSLILGSKPDFEHYTDSASAIKDRINRKWFDYDNNYYFENSQTAQALGLFFDLVPEDRYDKCAENLLAMLDRSHNHINCGIVGTWIIFDTLTKLGQKQRALDILLNEDQPGFAYMIKRGATTLWETWDGQCSRNHPMFGTVDAWIQKNIGGLEYIEGEFVFTVPDLAGINRAKTSLKTDQGFVVCSWTKTAKSYNVNVEAPEDVTVKLKFDSIPDYETEIVSEESTTIKLN
ncbi:MAG: family 78 glycoside hydrolase catalytic domain [Armatimonadetes bacterium]|nr:family 78 glycoside hydrolase catalytic domain [Candidatus Hippobium faecium]